MSYVNTPHSEECITIISLFCGFVYDFYLFLRMNNFATKRTYRSVEAPIVPLMSLSFRSNIQKEKEPHKNAVWHFYKTLNTTGGKDKCSYLQRKKV